MSNPQKSPSSSYLTPTVWALSLVSLFTDVASEMLYPIMPIYLKTIGFSVVLIGVLEGIAEATAGLSKSYFGKLSDYSGRRAPFVQLGYVLSSLSKPMMAVFTFPLWIFFARTLDRFGKGIRTGARDAILSGEASAAMQGRVFGFHRSMDTLGAFIGPSLALLYLYFYPNDYKTLFLLAFIPGILAVLASLYLKDKKPTNQAPTTPKPHFFSFLSYWKESPQAYRKLIIGLLLFTLFNSSDAFLLLKAKQSGLEDTSVILLYIFYNFIYAVAAFPLGVIADKVGLKTIYVAGLVVFAGVYVGVAITANLYVFLGLFLLYGIYSAATEGISKAWISTVTDKKARATALGTFSGFQSICAMLASSLTGVVWFYFGATIALLITALGTLLVIAYFSMVVKPSPQE